MTTPTLVRPKAIPAVPAMQVPPLTDQPALARFLLWAQTHDLSPNADGTPPGLTLDAGTGNPRPLEPGTWVIVQRDARDRPYLETCDPQHFADSYEPVRPLRVETYRSRTTEVTTLGDLEPTTLPAEPGDYRWRVVHTTNGEVMASGEGYTDPRDRDHAIELLWPDLEVTEENS